MIRYVGKAACQTEAHYDLDGNVAANLGMSGKKYWKCPMDFTLPWVELLTGIIFVVSVVIILCKKMFKFR